MSNDLGFELPPAAKLTKTRGVAVALAALVLLAAAFLVGWLPKRLAKKDLASENAVETSAKTRVQAVVPKLKQQELDQKQAQAAVDAANVKASEAMVSAQNANVRRFAQLKSFARVTAPFAGTVNARMVERGAVVSPTTPLFKISANDPVRVYVQIPQDVATSVKPSMSADVSVREYAGRAFKGTVARSAGSLDPASRTMNTEVRVPNPKGELFAGMYAQVAVSLPSPHRTFELPPTSLITDAQGTRVATVDASNKIHLVRVVVERDTGATVEVSSGLEGNERVVKPAAADLTEGKAVDVVP